MVMKSQILLSLLMLIIMMLSTFSIIYLNTSCISSANARSIPSIESIKTLSKNTLRSKTKSNFNLNQVMQSYNRSAVKSLFVFGEMIKAPGFPLKN